MAAAPKPALAIVQLQPMEVQVVLVLLPNPATLKVVPSTEAGLAGEAAALLVAAAPKPALAIAQLQLTVEQLAVVLLLSPAILSFALTILAPPILVTQQAVGIM